MSSAANVISARAERDRRTRANLDEALGPVLLEYLHDPNVVEVMLNPTGELWLDRLGEPMTPAGLVDSQSAESIMRMIASYHSIELGPSQPILECELPFYEMRFEGMIPPVVDRPSFAIRKKASKVFPLDDYVENDRMSAAAREVIQAAVRDRKNILVAGATSSGKTTFTNAVLLEICSLCPDDRIVSIEDTRELQISAANYVDLRADENADMLKCLKATLRLRPDRIVVGEVRDKAALALLKAWNTGHPGGVATIHADSGIDALMRLEQLVAEGTSAPAHLMVAQAIGLVVFMGKGRRVVEILQVKSWRDGSYETQAVEI
jgi:type IV secretion system protein VirB11